MTVYGEIQDPTGDSLRINAVEYATAWAVRLGGHVLAGIMILVWFALLAIFHHDNPAHPTAPTSPAPA